MFRWDLWIEGALASGLVSMIAVAPAIVANGITEAELWALLAGFLGGIGLFCKTHPPKPWEGTERRNTDLK